MSNTLHDNASLSLGGSRWPQDQAGIALQAAVLVVATFTAYFPAIFAGYIWDDAKVLYANPLIQAPDGLKRIWFTTEAEDYWPLCYTMFWFEWRIWGSNPMPYHIGNIALHALAAVLLWRVLRRLNLGDAGAFLGAMIFAVHPVTVASVAWITERKNVLSMAFYLASILAYLRHEDQVSRRWYAVSLIAAAAALLAKTSAVVLPVVLLLLSWWRPGRVTPGRVLRVLPFFVLSLAMGLATVWFQHHNAIMNDVVRPEGMASRVAASGWIAWFYLYKDLVPIGLAMIYPRWDVDGGRLVSFLPLALLIGGFAVLWVCRGGWSRGPLAALGYFVIALGPMLGFVDMSYMKNSLVADHLQYVAMPGVIALAAGVLANLGVQRQGPAARPARLGRAALCAAVVLVLAVLTWKQAETYKDEETLWNHAIRLYDRSWAAYNNRGAFYDSLGDSERAIDDLSEAIRLKPDYADAYNNRGIAYYHLEDWDRAMGDYGKAIELNPNDATTYNNRGALHNRNGHYDRAIRDYTKAIELDPGYASAYDNRAKACFSLGQYDKAWADVWTCRQLGGRPSPDLIQSLSRVTVTSRSE